jgi:hypothetical protein
MARGVHGTVGIRAGEKGGAVGAGRWSRRRGGFVGAERARIIARGAGRRATPGRAADRRAGPGLAARGCPGGAGVHHRTVRQGDGRQVAGPVTELGARVARSERGAHHRFGAGRASSL